MNSKILSTLLILVFLSCKSKQTEVDPKTMDKFDAFIQKEKFVKDMTIFYPGIADPTLRPVLTEKINQAAEDFRSVALSSNPTQQAYLEKIKIGLKRFENTSVMYDSEDKERVCHYFEELMNIVGLKSSDGILNTFLYGFNPDEKSN